MRTTASAHHASPSSPAHGGCRRYATLLGALLLLVLPAAAYSTSTRAPTTSSKLHTTSIFPPTLPVTDGVDISTLRTGAPVARTLEQQLQLLFEAFLADSPQGSTEAVKVQVSYSTSLSAGVPPVTTPLLFLPPTTFNIPDDWSPGVPCQLPQDPALVCALAKDIRAWLSNQGASFKNAQLTFDLAGLPTTAGGFAPPNLQAQNLALPFTSITNP